MTTLSGTIEEIDAKTSKKGTTYHRMKVRNDAGNVAWWTYFGTVHRGSLGANITASLKPMGDGEIIDDYHVIAQGEAPQKTGFAAYAQSSAPSAGGAGQAGHRDMWIAVECFYQHWLHSMAAGLDPAQEPLSGPEVKTMIAHCVDAAIYVNECFAVYEREGVAAARTRIQAGIAGSPAAKAAELEQRAAQSNADAVAGEDADPFDDSIPF